MISYTIKNISGSIGQLAIDDIILNQGESAIIYVKTPDVIAAEAAGLISVTQNGTDTEITGADVITALGYTPYSTANPSGYTSNSGTVTNFVFTNSNGFTGSVSNSNSTPTLSLTLQDASTSLSGRLTNTDWNTFNNKQELLVSATNIKTINGESILGAGNIVTSGGGGGGSGTVTTISINSANGFAGSVLNATSTPAITLSTSITGLVKGNGTALSAATAGTDYLAPNGSGANLSGITSSQIAGGEATANKDVSNGYAGLTLLKINFKNVANTFTSFFTNTNTAARTYTFQNRDGTIADDTDLAGKQATLVSATNIKTIDGVSVLGSGDISISNKTITVTGDVTGSGTNAITLTLANVATGATATKVTFNNKGLITSSSSLNSSDITTALTFTPYNATNPNGYTSNTGTVTTASVVSANGFAGSVANSTTTPAITISTSITGVLKGNGTAILQAVAGTDYLTPSDISGKQDTLVSATNIKTINGNSILGSGNLVISGGGGSTSISKTATGSVTAYTVVKYVSATNVSTASNADSDLFNVVGVAESSVSNGASVSITPTGQEITNGSWTWTPLALVYLSTAGALTQTEPTTNSVIVIGVALSATVLKVNIGNAVALVA